MDDGIVEKRIPSLLNNIKSVVLGFKYNMNSHTFASLVAQSGVVSWISQTSLVLMSLLL